MRPFSVLIVGVLIVLASCSGRKVDENDPNSVLQDAESEVESDHYQIALEKFRNVKNRFPYSAAAITAQLRIADVYFLQQSWGEAATAYEIFRDLHPKHEKTPYASFRIAKSYFNDIPDPIARDMTSAAKALDSYNEFLRRYPDSAQNAEALKDRSDTRKMLAEKETLIADFYYKRDLFDSAVQRYRKVIEIYSDSPFVDHAKERLAAIDQIPPKEKTKRAADAAARSTPSP